MSFERLTPPPKPAKATDPVRIAVKVSGKSPSRLTLILTAEALDKIDKKARRNFHVELGSAEDKHLLRINASEDGLFQATPVKARGRGDVFRIILPPHVRWPQCRVKAQAAKFDQVGLMLQVALPAWAWDDSARKSAEHFASLAPKKGGAK